MSSADPATLTAPTELRPTVADGYYVGRDGSVWTEHRGPARPLQASRHRNGQYLVSIHHRGGQRTYGVAQLVLRAFVGEPPPGKKLAIHRDLDPANNAADNLFWGDRRDLGALQRGRKPDSGDRHYRCKVTDADVARMRARAAAGEKPGNLAAEYGLATNTVYQILKRTRRKGA